MLALLQLPALFHYGETLATTTVEAPSIRREISTALPDQFLGPSVWPPAAQNSCCACGTYIGVAISWGRRMVRVRSCCLHMFPSIRDEIKIYSLPADCSDKFSAPDRGSVSNSCALWRFGRRREPSQLMCFLIPCIASKFHAMSFFLFRIYSESIPNPIQKPIPKLQKREKTQDILRFLDFWKEKEFFFFLW